MKVLTLYHLHDKLAEHAMQDNQEIIIGRSEDCNISIDDHLISRRHLRIFFENDHWNIECLSRFSQLKGSDGHTFSQKTIDADSSFEFWVANYKVHISNPTSQKSKDNTSLIVLPDQNQKDHTSDENLESFNANMANLENSEIIPLEEMDNKSLSNIDPSNTSPHVPDKNPEVPNQKDDQDRTQLVQQGVHLAHLEARIKVLKKVGEEEQFVLKGTKWTIGRSKNCEILLNHPKISRAHCEITYIEDEYYIKDLKSANGTSLNGKKISHLQATLLQSNDHIHIEDLMLCFELYNTNIEERLSDLNVEKDIPHSPKVDMSSNAPVYIPNNSAPQPINEHSSGVVRIPSNVKSKKLDRKKIIRLAMIALTVIVGYILISDNSQEIESESISSESDSAQDEFEKLTPEQKSTVVNSYTVAKELQAQSKFRVALTEIQKIHALISSYKDSRDIEKTLEASLETFRQYEEIKQRLEDEQRLKQEVADTIDRCRQESQSYTDLTRLQNCLQPAIERDPDNPHAQSLIEEMNNKIIEEEVKNKNRARYLARVRSGKKLHEKAKSLQDKEQLLDAIDAYQKHINSRYPDPKKLKDKSKVSIDQIRKTITDKITFYQKKADEKIEAKDYKRAILLLRKALKLDPSLVSSKKKLVEYSSTLIKQMKVLYSESILDESLGHLEEAKEKWRKISKLDLLDGEYHKKAKIKLRKYEL